MKGIGVFMCVVLASVVTTASVGSFARVFYEEWKVFKLEHKKRYGSEQEEQFRMKVYLANKWRVARHNQRAARGHVGFTLKLNKYSDLTHREFDSALNGYDDTTRGSNGNVSWELHYEPAANVTPLPAEVDWRRQGAVTEVKDQEMCRSCWAFTATGALEAQHFRQTGQLISLSEQNLVDCSREYGNRGCKGGDMKKAFTYIRYNRGVDTENSYPYEAMDDSCRYNPRNAGAEDGGYVVVPARGREWVLQHAVAHVGPVAAAICSLRSFELYSSGVYDDRRCTAHRRRNHAVLIVGYGTDETGKDYWLVKNSLGPSWGLQGYGKILRNRNMCGIASDTSYPIV